MTLPVTVLFSAAITVVFVTGPIFAPLQNRGPALWRELVSCVLCSGVWIGGGMAYAAGYRGVVELLGIAAVSGVAALVADLGIDFLVRLAHPPSKAEEYKMALEAMEQMTKIGTKFFQELHRAPGGSHLRSVPPPPATCIVCGRDLEDDETCTHVS